MSNVKSMSKSKIQNKKPKTPAEKSKLLDFNLWFWLLAFNL